MNDPTCQPPPDSWDELRRYAESQGEDFDALVDAAAMAVSSATSSPWTDADIVAVVEDMLADDPPELDAKIVASLARAETVSTAAKIRARKSHPVATLPLVSPVAAVRLISAPPRFNS